MSFKQMLKMKLPFTRKGLEDCLDEKLALLQRQQAEEMNRQLHRRINDLEQAVETQAGTQGELLFNQLKEEMNLQLHRRINDLQQAIALQLSSQTSELSSFVCIQQTGNTNVGIKNGRQVFLFAAASDDSHAIKLAQTFHDMGCAVHYLYGNKPTGDARGLAAVPMVEYSCVDTYSADQFADVLSTGALLVFAISILPPPPPISAVYLLCPKVWVSSCLSAG